MPVYVNQQSRPFIQSYIKIGVNEGLNNQLVNRVYYKTVVNSYVAYFYKYNNMTMQIQKYLTCCVINL